MENRIRTGVLAALIEQKSGMIFGGPRAAEPKRRLWFQVSRGPGISRNVRPARAPCSTGRSSVGLAKATKKRDEAPD